MPWVLTTISGTTDLETRKYLGDDVGQFWGQNGQAWIPITMAVVYNWAVDLLENEGYITYYGDANADVGPDEADVDHYSALYVHSTSGRTYTENVPIPDSDTIAMTWLKEIDNFFVNSINGLTVTDPIKHYAKDEHNGKLFGSTNDHQNYTQLATISDTISDGANYNTLTLDTVDGITEKMYFIYSDTPIRTNFVSKDFAKYRSYIDEQSDSNAATKT